MNASILQRLKRSEEDLLDAMISDGPILEQFSQDWSRLYSDVEAAMASHQLEETTIQLAHTVASSVRLLSGSILSCREEVDSIAAAFEKELDNLFAAISLDDQTTLLQSTSTRPQPASFTSYIKPAYAWLLENLHNPYPPKHVKDAFSRGAGCHIKDVDHWFVDARRRIGWNKLRRTHFGNKRQEIVAAAMCFFGKADGSRKLDSQLEFEFATIQNRAENLYYDKLKEDRLASRAVSPTESSHSEHSEASTTQSEHPEAENPPVHLQHRILSGVNDSEQERSVDPSAKSASMSCPGIIRHEGRKRRCDDEQQAFKVTKKRKIASPAASPSAEIPPVEQFCIGSETFLSLGSLESPIASRKRKRQLSHSEIGSFRCTTTLPVAPRHHPTSDPPPIDIFSNTDTQWLFDMAHNQSIHVGHGSDLDSSAPLEIELFDPSQLFASFGIPEASNDCSLQTSLLPPSVSTNNSQVSVCTAGGDPPVSYEATAHADVTHLGGLSLPNLGLDAAPDNMPSGDLDWLFTLLNDKTWNNAYPAFNNDLCAFDFPSDTCLTASC